MSNNNKSVQCSVASFQTGNRRRRILIRCRPFIGLLVGMSAAFATTRLLRSLLYQVDALDLPTFVIVAAVLVAVGFLASWLPARRASSVNPITALRTE